MITRYWSRAPGVFVDKNTGIAPKMPEGFTGSLFTGTVREWYETLVEEIAILHFDTDRKANAIIMSKDVMWMLNCTSTFECQNNTGEFSGLDKFGTLQNCGLGVYVDNSMYSSTCPRIELAFLRNKRKDNSIERNVIAQLQIQDRHCI